MTAKSLALSLFGLVALAVALGFALTSAVSGPDPERFVAREDYEDLSARHEKLKALLDKTAAEKTDALERNRKLESQVATLDAELESLRKPPTTPAEQEEKSASSGKTPPIAFGKWAELDAVKNANWAEMAEAVDNINLFVLELLEAIEQDEPPDAELQEKIRKENHKLVRYAAEVMGKIPTHSPINGEFSHPITLANLTAALLERTEIPLSAEQRSEIAALGNGYEAVYEELQSTYGEDTPRLEKLVDELELKRDTINSMHALLTDEQREFVVHPDIHHRLQLDTLSPFTMAILLAKQTNASSLEKLRAELPEKICQKFGIDREKTKGLDAVADSWMREMDPILKPVARADKFIHIDRAITAGRAQVKAMKELLSLPDLDDKARKAILADLSWHVPQIVGESEQHE